MPAHVGPCSSTQEEGAEQHGGDRMQEEFLSAYAEQLGVVSRQAELQKELEQSSDNMDR